MMAIEPITRKERFLAKAGGQQVGDLKPITREEMFLSKIGGGGGSSVQSDWSQNDPNAPDFVKNRTHYEGLATIIEEREVHAWFEWGTLAASRIPQVGEKLTVTLNGNTYKCTAWESRQEGEVCLGNGDFDSMSDRGENVPFGAGFFVDDEGGAGAFIATAMIGENTISVVDDSGNTLIEGTFNVEVNADEPMYSASFPLDQPLIVGNTYKVVYDGVPYECVAWEDSGDINLGNGEIDGYEHSEDVPFLITTSQFDELWCLCFFGSGTHTVSVSEIVVHKLDPKYLPDDIGGGSGGETYDIDIVGRDNVWTLVAGSFEDIKTRLINGDVFNCRIRSCSSYNSEAYYAASTTYNMEDEDISISVLGISTATVKVHQVVIRPDNSVGFYYSSN